MESIKENSNRYRRVKRALFGDATGKIKTFAIISPENPLGFKNTDDKEWLQKYEKWQENKSKYNKDAVDDLKKELLADRIKKNGDTTMRMGGFNYVQIKGSYGDREKTFMVFNISLADAKIIARNYGQESFFWGKVSQEEGTPSTIGYYKTTNSCKTYNLVEVSDTIYDATDADDFFSKFGLKYRIGMQEFGDDVREITDTKEFEESLDEERTFMSRAQHRRSAYATDTINENSSTRVKSALFDRTHRVRTFAILTAENPNNMQLSAEENNSRMKSLKETLRGMRINYVKIEGNYNRKEHSVLATNLTLTEAEYLADRYEQESFFFGDKDGIYYYEQANKDSEYELKDKTNKIMNAKDADNFFSRYGDFKFSIYMDYFNEGIDESIDVKCLDRSLREGGLLETRVKYRNMGNLFNTEVEPIIPSDLFNDCSTIRTLAIIILPLNPKCSEEEFERELSVLQLSKSFTEATDKCGKQLVFIANGVLEDVACQSRVLGSNEFYFCSTINVGHFREYDGGFVEDAMFDGIDTVDDLCGCLDKSIGAEVVKESYAKIKNNLPRILNKRAFDESFDESLTCKGRINRRARAIRANFGGNK